MSAITNSTSYSSWLNSDKDLSTSPFGRKLSFPGACARFSTIDRTSTAAKVVAWTIQVIAVAVLASPIILLGATWVSLISVSLALPVTFANVVTLVGLAAISVFASVKYYDEVFSPTLNERGVQMEEQQIIDALGGKEEFDKLPRFTKEKIDEISNRTANVIAMIRNPTTGLELRRIYASDVNAPITVGVDLLGRPFISMRLIFKTHNPLTLVDTYVSKYSPVRSNSWVFNREYTGPNGPAPFSEDVGQCSETIRQLKNGTHPTLKLV